MTEHGLRTVRHEKPIDILPGDSVHAIREATFRRSDARWCTLNGDSKSGLEVWP